jgi:deazaflavin-dependent oxidoreductase (nitroreductase family)
MPRYVRPSWFGLHVQDPAVRFFMRLGISVWGARILRVRGRKSGEWRSSPVNLLTYQGKQYLVSPRGHTQWVRNIRESGGGELVLGARTTLIKAVEIPDDRKVPILRDYLRRWKFEVGIFFGGVSADSSDEELRRIAPEHPVFLVEPLSQSSP